MSKKGSIPWNKNKKGIFHHSLESRKKMSLHNAHANLGRKQPKEEIERRNKSLKIAFNKPEYHVKKKLYICSEETKKKLRQYKPTEECKRNISLHNGRGMLNQKVPEERKKLISKNVKIAMWSPEVRVKTLLHNKSGGEAPGWKGGLSFEPYDENFNYSFKKRIKLRDNNICQICYQNKILNVHHIDYNKQLTIEENCISLCQKCHAKTNWNRHSWVQFFQDLLNKKYGYEYDNNKIVITLKNENL